MHSQKYFKQSAERPPPSEADCAVILRILENEYRDAIWKLEDDWDSRDAYMRALGRLENSSSPGYPYMKEYPTIGEWLGWNGLSYSSLRVELLWLDVQQVLRGENELVLRGFIKQEPHKIAKCVEGRWRLIMAFPLSVQVVWHMVFDSHADETNFNSYTLPSKQGMKIVNGHWKQHYNQWKHRGYNCGLDKSAWDWCFPYWQLQLCQELRFRLGRGSRMNEWNALARRLREDAFVNPLIVLSDGTLLRQTVPGVQKSGSVTTINDNSVGQCISHIRAWQLAGQSYSVYPLPAAVGDDTLQRDEQCGDIDHYLQQGIVVKSLSLCLEFIGHEFTDRGPLPLYIAKHLMKLQYTSDEVLPQYLDLSLIHI